MATAKPKKPKKTVTKKKTTQSKKKPSKTATKITKKQTKAVKKPSAAKKKSVSKTTTKTTTSKTKTKVVKNATKAPAKKKVASKTSPKAATAKKAASPSKTTTTKTKKTTRTKKAPITAQKPRDIAGMEPYIAKANENYMNDNQSKHFQQLLHNWKLELLEESKRTVNTMQGETGNLPDPSDRASLEEERRMELREGDRIRKLIKKIDKTIEKIHSEDYGYCEACGIEIGIERLEARPTADLCIDCKMLEEIREKQQGI